MRPLPLLPLLLTLLLGLASCGTDPVPAAPGTCDAGDAAWVHRIFPLVWGRRPHGAAEVILWTAAVGHLGRAGVVRAMAQDPAYLDHWQDVLLDTLQVARTGDRAATACYSRGLLEDDQALAGFLETHPATSAPAYARPFNMADVLRSALRADRLAVIWRVHLFARMSTPLQGANVGPLELEESRRVSFGEAFFSTYLHRDLTCLPCHNAGGSASVAAPLPGAVEAALLGDAAGIPAAQAYQPSRYAELARGGAVQPWGMSDACGTVQPPEALTEDLLGSTGFFITDLGERGSVWDIEAALWAGVAAVEGAGLVVAGDGTVEPEAAFAALLAQTIADRVWTEAVGAPLTLAHNLPRSAAQRDRLAHFSQVLAESGFSLQDLLVAVAEDPVFNMGLPETCGAAVEGLAPIIDPFREHNGPGDRVRRHPAQVLLRSAHDALGWPAPARFPAVGDPIADLQGELGAFLREAQPGFSGTDFQVLLAVEASYGTCEAPLRNNDAGDGCDDTPATPGCGSCACESCTCALEPYCCEVQWDDLCVEICEETCGGCGGQPTTGEDAVAWILARAADEGASVGEAAEALQDRILSRGALGLTEDTEEGALIAALLEAPLDQTATRDPALERGMRLLCGALLRAPQAMLALEPPADLATVPRLAVGVAEDCARLEALVPDLPCPIVPP